MVIIIIIIIVIIIIIITIIIIIVIVLIIDKELEKLEKNQLLKDEIAKVWRMQKVIVVSVVVGVPWSSITQL